MAAGLGFKTFTSGEVLTAADTNGYLMQGINVFANASARTAAITSPQEGQYSYLKDTNALEYYDGAAWVGAPIGDITAVTAGKGLTGGGSSGDVTVSLGTTAKGDLVVGSGASTAAVLTVGSNGETLVADSSTSTGLRYQGSQAAAKNCIINGGLDIWQRGTSFTGSGAYVYTTDRWQGFLASTYSITQIDVSSLVSNFQWGARGQRASGQTTTNYFNFEQGLETETILPLRGNVVTVSFWARCGANFSPTSSQLGVTFFCGTGAERVRNVTAFTSETSPINTNATLTTTYQKFTFTSTAIPTTTTQAALTFSAYPTGTAGANDWFEVTGVQLEIGSVATTFTRAGGTIQGELAACQRYYYRQTADATATYAHLGQSRGDGATSAVGQTVLPVTMRVTPTSVDYATVAVTDGAAVYGATAVALASNQNDAKFAAYTMTFASGVTQFRYYYVVSNNSATGYLGFSAEL